MHRKTFKPIAVFVGWLALVLGSAGWTFAMTSINCGLSLPIGPTPRATSTGHTEPIAAGPPILDPSSLIEVSPPTPGGGRLRVTCINNTGATAGSTTDPGVVALTISLGAPITNTTSGLPSGGTGIRLADFVGDFNFSNVAIKNLTNASGTIVIQLGTPAGNATTGILFTAGPFTSSFEIEGVLVSVNNKTAPIYASLSSTPGVTVGPAATGAGMFTGQATVSVIDSLVPGLQDPDLPSPLPLLPFFWGVSGGSAVLNAMGAVVKGNFVLRIPEGYPDMFRESNQFNGPGITGVFPNSPATETQVKIVLNNIPNGLDISNCSATVTDASGTAITGGVPSLNFTSFSTSSAVTVNFNNALDLDHLDVLWIKCESVSVGSASVPLPSTPVTAQVTLALTGQALTANGTAFTGLTTGQVPRYQQLLLPANPIPVVTFATVNSLPWVTGMVPPSGDIGTTFSATITGLNLAGATAVTFTGTGVTAVIEAGGTSTSIPVTVTISDSAPIGLRSVTVIRDGFASNSFVGFTVTNPLATPPFRCFIATPLGPTAHATATGHTEPVGAGPTGIPPPGGGVLRVTCINSNMLALTTSPALLTIDLGVQTTNSPTHPSAAAGIRLANTTGDFLPTNVGIVSINENIGQISVALGTPKPPQNQTTGIAFTGSGTSSFDLLGILISLDGTGRTKLDATLNFVTGPEYTAFPNTTEVISSVLPGLQDPSLLSGPAVVNSNGATLVNNFTISIPENYPEMFKESTQFNGGAVFPATNASDTQINFVFSDVPPGLDISNCQAVLVDSLEVLTAGIPVLSSTSVTANAPVLTVSFLEAVNPSRYDILRMSCNSVGAGTAALPLSPTPVTVKVFLGPTGSALSNQGTPLTDPATGQIPRYQDSRQPANAITVIEFPLALPLSGRRGQITSQ